MMAWFTELFWTSVLGFSVMMYVMLDGFDLGVGIIFPWIRNIKQRDIMMGSIAPLWDGNETWLVFATVVLYAAFPKVYSQLLPIFYLPIMFMLMMLVLRGITFEFRFKTEPKYRPYWSMLFGVSSTLASFCQGVMLGTFLQGHFAYDYVLLSEHTVWLTPFSVMTGLGVVSGYVLIGAAWLIKKTTGSLQKKMIPIAKVALVVVSLFMLLVSSWTPFISQVVFHRWFSVPNFYFLSLLPIVAGVVIIKLWLALLSGHESKPFFLSLALFFLCFLGLAISIWPYIIPYRVTVSTVLNTKAALDFTFWGVVLVVPVLLSYTLYGYKIFQGKVQEDQLYH
jgi:cytochrome bd ubiquinol oxidase subunit II